MEFKEFKQMLQDNFAKISKDVDYLFEVEVDKDELWELYLNSFPEGTNEVYRERREYDCSSCRQFIKNFGNVVVVKNNQVRTIWEFETNSPKFDAVVTALDIYIKSKDITNVYVSKESKIGVDKNHEQYEDTPNVFTWHHLFVQLPKKFVDKSRDSIPEIKGKFRDIRNVFKRSLDEINEESVVTVLELISSNTLYKGEEWKTILEQFLAHQRVYNDHLFEEEQINYTWEKSVTIGSVIGKIRNHSIGTLLLNISENMDLEEAVKKYESIVAPSNYKRPKAIYTKKMLENAKKTVEELGLMDSLGRRFAKLDDITVNNILYVNKDIVKKLGNTVFDEMSETVAQNPKHFDRVEEIDIKDFVKNVIPMVNEVEVLVENRLANNMVSLIAPKNSESKNMLKWLNPFSWAYKGNITDSSMKERVKAAGGNVEGVLRFSIQWNDEPGGYDRNDLDAHCVEPSGNEIYYANNENRATSGALDVDIINPKAGTPAVENITWLSLDKMQSGNYKMFVHNYSHRGGRAGFKAEIEFDGQIYSFEYNKELRQRERVPVAEVSYDRDHGFKLTEKLPSNVSSRQIWNLQSNQFVPVSILMYSPNYWDDQNGIGHRHYFFMLKDCINSESPNGFYNEFLKQDLMEHKKVFEALGSKMKVEDTEDQLSGVGFSSTKRNTIVVKVKGQTERIMKVKF